MKKKLPFVLFTISTVLLILFLALSVDFIVNCVNYPSIETDGDFLGASIIISTYAFMSLIISVSGLLGAVNLLSSREAYEKTAAEIKEEIGETK